MKRKIKTTNYDGTIIEVEVNISIYNFDKENYWQEDWRDRKSKQESSLEEIYSYYEKGGIPPELQEESTELTYIRNFEYEEGLFTFMENCFVKRRKTLNNNLKEFLDKDVIDKLYKDCDLKENVRAQELELEDFIRLYEVLRCI